MLPGFVKHSEGFSSHLPSASDSSPSAGVLASSGRPRPLDFGESISKCESRAALVATTDVEVHVLINGQLIIVGSRSIRQLRQFRLDLQSLELSICILLLHLSSSLFYWKVTLPPRLLLLPERPLLPAFRIQLPLPVLATYIGSLAARVSKRLPNALRFLHNATLPLALSVLPLPLVRVQPSVASLLRPLCVIASSIRVSLLAPSINIALTWRLVHLAASPDRLVPELLVDATSSAPPKCTSTLATTPLSL